MVAAHGDGWMIRRSMIMAMALAAGAAGARAEPCCDPASPFRAGEGYADEAATCETLGRWIDRAPTGDERISMTVRGALSHVETDGTLAYLIMCPDGGVQVMCVTYETNGLKPGDEVTFGGGYARVGERQIMLDPCLADRR